MPNQTPAPSHPDDQLPAPLRWATQLFSSWWVLVVLVLVVAAYIIAAYLPVGGRYLWQASWIDAPQSRVLSWQPFHMLLMLLGCVTLWTTVRRVPWRLRNLGLFGAALGFVAALLGLSVGWRYQTHGLLAVQPIDAEPLPLQTRYLEPTERVLFVQIGQSPPQQVPLDGLPLWGMPPQGSLAIPLHTEPGLRSQLDYRAQVHVVEYIPQGRLVRMQVDGIDTDVAPALEKTYYHEHPRLGCPTDALLAVRFTTNSADGPGGETIVWLAFDLAAGQRVMPPRSYDIPGLGEVHLAFTLASYDLGFAAAAEPDVKATVALRIVDTDPVTRQVIPAIERSLNAGEAMRYRAAKPHPTLREATLTAGPWINRGSPQWVNVSATPARMLVYIGLAVSVAGLLLALLAKALTKNRKTDAPG